MTRPAPDLPVYGIKSAIWAHGMNGFPDWALRLVLEHRDAIFNELARRAALNMAEYPNATEIYLRLALKAQSQCRATLETLAAIKNPPIVYARQANVTTGPQQVNNGMPVPSRAREIEIEQSKQSGGHP